jgi:hypothetical protein
VLAGGPGGDLPRPRRGSYRPCPDGRGSPE